MKTKAAAAPTAPITSSVVRTGLNPRHRNRLHVGESHRKRRFSVLVGREANHLCAVNDRMVNIDSRAIQARHPNSLHPAAGHHVGERSALRRPPHAALQRHCERQRADNPDEPIHEKRSTVQVECYACTMNRHDRTARTSATLRRRTATYSARKRLSSSSAPYGNIASRVSQCCLGSPSARAGSPRPHQRQNDADAARRPSHSGCMRADPVPELKRQLGEAIAAELRGCSSYAAAATLGTDASRVADLRRDGRRASRSKP